LAYFAIQDLLFKAKDEVDLSAYRFQLETLWNVAILGVLPPEKIKNQTHTILEQKQGVFIQLPEDVLDFLKDRRERATQISPWIEGHYHPSTSPRYKRKPKK